MGFLAGSDLFSRGLHTRIAVARHPCVSLAFLLLLLKQKRTKITNNDASLMGKDSITWTQRQRVFCSSIIDFI